MSFKFGRDHSTSRGCNIHKSPMDSVREPELVIVIALPCLCNLVTMEDDISTFLCNLLYNLNLPLIFPSDDATQSPGFLQLLYCTSVALSNNLSTHPILDWEHPRKRYSWIQHSMCGNHSPNLVQPRRMFRGHTILSIIFLVSTRCIELNILLPVPRTCQEEFIGHVNTAWKGKTLQLWEPRQWNGQGILHWINFVQHVARTKKKKRRDSPVSSDIPFSSSSSRFGAAFERLMI